MRWTGGVLVMLGAGCASVSEDPAALRAGQERACAAVVAEHVGMGTDQVTAAWQGLTASGNAVVMVDVPGRPHSCEVDGELRVYQLQHPGE